jgi:hypothetical protein
MSHTQARARARQIPLFVVATQCKYIVLVVDKQQLIEGCSDRDKYNSQ